MLKKILLFFLLLQILFSAPAFAAVDPRLSPNNNVGINSLSPDAEIDDISSLVNTNGDWGYVVITITKSQRDTNRWQQFLNQANKHHLIPIIRIATEFNTQNGYWEKPSENDAREWADFLSKLYFPTKNRYVQVYNEVNRASEWGGNVDPASYSKELDKAITALKSKSNDYFVLNAPLDLSLTNLRNSIEPSYFFSKMEESVPEIFNRLDGWASHSYPNPGFSAPPDVPGKTGISGYLWELSQISPYTGGKDFPVFITETGWRQGVNGEYGLNEDQISEYYKLAYANFWSDKRVVTAAPFLLSYPEDLFDQFSFRIFGSQDKKYYKYFYAIRDMPKVKGEPERENEASDLQIFKPNFFMKNIGNYITVNFKNTGNHIWNSKKDLIIEVLGENTGNYQTFFSKEETYPGEEVQAIIKIESVGQGIAPLTIRIIDNDKVLAIGEIFMRSETNLSLFFQRLRSFL